MVSFSPLQPHHLSNLHNHRTCQANGCKIEIELYYERTRLESTRSGLPSNLCGFNPTHPKTPKVPNTSNLTGGNRRGRLLMTVDIPSLSNKRHRANMVIKSSSHLHFRLIRSVTFILGKEIPDLVYCTHTSSASIQRTQNTIPSLIYHAY